LTSPPEYPGVDRAYDFVLPSYNWALDRLKAVDSRLQEIMAYAATLTFASPIVAGAVLKKPEYNSPCFYGSLALFVVVIAIGLYFRARGNLHLVTPAALYDLWLYKDEPTFKKDAVYFAGKHMAMNQRLINRKGHAADMMTVLLGAELLLLLDWIIRQV